VKDTIKRAVSQMYLQKSEREYFRRKSKIQKTERQ